MLGPVTRASLPWRLPLELHCGTSQAARTRPGSSRPAGPAAASRIRPAAPVLMQLHSLALKPEQPGQLQQARVLLDVAGLPLTIPSNRNHLCLLHEALSWARIMFGVTDVHLTFSFTRNYHHLINGVLNRAIHPPEIFSFPPWCFQQGQGQIGHC